MFEHLLFLAFLLPSPPLVYKVLNFLYSHVRKTLFIKEMEVALDDLSFKILECMGKW